MVVPVGTEEGVWDYTPRTRGSLPFDLSPSRTHVSRQGPSPVVKVIEDFSQTPSVLLIGVPPDSYWSHTCPPVTGLQGCDGTGMRNPV